MTVFLPGAKSRAWRAPTVDDYHWEARAMPATHRALPVSLHLAADQAAFAAFARIRPFRSNAPEYTCVGASSFTVTSPFTST